MQLVSRNLTRKGGGLVPRHGVGAVGADGINSSTRPCLLGVDPTPPIVFVMRSILQVFSCVLWASLATAIPAAAAVVPPAGSVKVTINVGLEGSGCRPEDAHVAIASDNSAMSECTCTSNGKA